MPDGLRVSEQITFFRKIRKIPQTATFAPGQLYGMMESVNLTGIPCRLTPRNHPKNELV